MDELKTLIVGPVTYRIEEEVRLIGSNGDGTSEWLNGQVKSHRLLMKLDAELPVTLKPICIMHEALHAILTQAGLDEQSEDVITCLGYGIVQLLQDNPRLVDLIMCPGDIQSLS